MQGNKAGAATIAAMTAILIGVAGTQLEAGTARAGTHTENMKVMCQRVREVNSKGLSGVGYLQWFFTKNGIASASAVPGFWRELKTYCPTIW